MLLLTIAALAAPVRATPAEARLVLHRYGECVVNQNPGEARSFLLNHVDARRDRGTGQLVEKLINSRCLIKATDNHGGAMRMPGDSMRYALADSLIRRELLGTAPVAAAAVAPLRHPVVDAERIMQSPVGVGGKDADAERSRRLAMAEAVAAMSRLGECIVRQAPAESLALFRTDPLSGEEVTAFAALTPTIATCVPAGSTVELTRGSLRGTIGVNYYRLANAPRVTSAAPGTAR